MEHWQFTGESGENVNGHYDGIAINYKINTETNVMGDRIRYTYTIEPPAEGKTHPELWLVPEPGSYKDQKEKEEKSMKIRITRVTKAEMTAEFVYDRFTTKTTRLVTDLF